MANIALVSSKIAKAALAVLDNEPGVLRTFYRAHESEFSQRIDGYTIGDTVSIRRPADFTVRTGSTASIQDVVEGKVTLTIDQPIGVDFQLSSTEMALQLPEITERIVKPAMTNIIAALTNDVLTQMYRGIYNWVGTPGGTVNTFAKFAAAAQRLDTMAVPQSDRASVLSPADFWGLIGNQTGLYITDRAKSAYESGDLGVVGGISTVMSQVTPTHTVGSWGGTPLINGANQNVTYVTAKDTWTQTLNTDGFPNSTNGVCKAGDVFTIAGVFMVNPKTKASTGILQQFVVTADANSGATTGPAALTISPPIIISGPHQTVSAAPADNAAMTVVGTASTGYVQNMAYHKNTMALAVVPLGMPPGAIGGARESLNGFSVRVQPYYDGTNDVSKWRLDMLYGRKLIDPRLATRFSG